MRVIDSIDVAYFKRFGIHRIAVKGPGFLRHMIRRIVGACLDVATSERSVDELSQALAAKNPHQHLHVAPPEGLMLHRISYKKTDENGLGSDFSS